MPPGEVQPRTVQQHIARLAPFVCPPKVGECGLVVFLRRCCGIVSGKFCIHRLVCHFDDGRKFLSRDVDTVPTVGYTTYRTITQKLSGRYCKPESAKKRDGSFFVYMNGDKINTILREHPEMTIREIQKIPELLDDPILILRSKGSGKGGNSRLVLFGSINTQDGQPVLAVLDLRPRENGFVLNDMQKVHTASWRRFLKETNKV